MKIAPIISENVMNVFMGVEFKMFDNVSLFEFNVKELLQFME